MSASSMIATSENSMVTAEGESVQPLTDAAPTTTAENAEVGTHSQSENVSAHSLDKVVDEIVNEKMPPGFDPTVHAVDADGKPKRRGDGSFALKRGRKPGGSAPKSSAAPAPNGEQKTGPIFSGVEKEQISNVEAARQICNLAIGTMVAFVGPEWAPESNDEAKALTLSVKNYFDAKGQIQLSPEWGLAFAVLAYSAPRFRNENTVSKFSKLKDKIRFVAMKIRDKFSKK